MLQMKSFKFFSLIDKSTNKEVYTSPYYTREDNETIDYHKVFDRFRFYFDRVNSGIKQQMESPKVPQDQKSKLQFLKPDNYLIALKELCNSGGYYQTQFWVKELSDFSDIKDYNYV